MQGKAFGVPLFWFLFQGKHEKERFRSLKPAGNSAPVADLLFCYTPKE